MLQTIVQRAPGDKQGPDISDPLLTTKDAQVARGRGEINENSSSRTTIAGNGPVYGYMEPGSVVQVTDGESGQYLAILDSWSLTISVASNQFGANSAVTLEKEQS